MWNSAPLENQTRSTLAGLALADLEQDMGNHTTRGEYIVAGTGDLV